MRIRTVKPEFWRSLDVAGLPRDIRLLFIGLWSYVDDNGVGIDDYRQIQADLFPLEDDPIEAREFVRDGLATLSRQGLVERYSVEGKRYITITGWRHQKVDRPNNPRYPTSDRADDSAPDEPSRGSREGSRDPRASLAPVTGEQGNRGTGESAPSERSRPAVVDAGARTVNQRAQALARGYYELEPLSKFEAIQKIAKKAIACERYTDDDIAAALARLADAKRSVTADSLRRELDGPPTPQQRMATSDARALQAQSLRRGPRHTPTPAAPVLELPTAEGF